MYQISDRVLMVDHSKAFDEFHYHWFKESRALTRGEVELGFLNDLTGAERKLAIELLRQNLHLKYTHIIDGLALLGDKLSVPALRNLLTDETDPSRRLSIAGALWRLSRDNSFPQLIEKMVRGKDSTIKQAHFGQILWLGNEQSISYLIELLEDSSDFVSFLALSRLNEIEFQEQFLMQRQEFPHQADYYLERRNDGDFLKSIADKLRARIESAPPEITPW